MTITINLDDRKEIAINAKAEALGITAEQYLQEMVDHDLEAAVQPSVENMPKRHISDVIRAIWSDLPDEAKAKLPADGASQVDHYVYGWPKRDQ